MTTYPIQFGRYQLLEPLAVGGMAELFRAQATGAHGFERTVVIKRILPHLAADARFTKMFITEAKITARLAHPKIAQTYELGTEGDQLFIAMEYVDGLDAHALLRELAHQQERMPPGVAVFVMHEVADALDFAHKQTGDDGEPLGIVHRDVSPSNVLMSTRGDVKLVDFGIAQAIQADSKTKSGTLKGKYGYMSPEQVVGDRVTAKSDLFAAGIVLAEMLMGRRLFAAPNELDVLLMVRDVQLARLDRYGADLPADLMEVVRRCLRKDPFERYADAAELRDALADWLFNNRKRVGARDVAELVSRYLDQARFRQSEMLKDATPTTHIIHPDDDVTEPAGAQAVAAAVGDRPPEEELLSDALLDESAVLQAAETPASAAPPPVSSAAVSPRAVSAAPKPPPVPASQASPRAASAAAAPAPVTPSKQPSAPVPAKSGNEEDADFFDFGDLDDVDLLSATERSVVAQLPQEPATARADTEVASPRAMSAERRSNAASSDSAAPAMPGPDAAAPVEPEMSGDSVPIIVGEPVETPFERAKPVTKHPPVEPSAAQPPAAPAAASRSREKRASGNFGSIEAAVASLALPDPDPSARDFDDQEVTEYPRPSIKKKMRDKPPGDAVRQAAAPPPTPRLKRISVSAAETGDLGETAPLKILFDKISSAATGLLVLESGAVKKEIYFVDGKPVYVASNMPSELLGTYLVDEGIISPGELDMALAMLPTYEGKLGDTLVGLGLVRPLDIFRHLTRQVRMKLVEACTWQAGVYQWYPERRITQDAFPLDIDPYEVLGAGAIALTPLFLQSWIERNKGNIPKKLESQLQVERFQVTGIEDVVDRIDGSSSVMEHCTRIRDPRDRGRFVRCLFLLLNVGLVTL